MKYAQFLATARLVRATIEVSQEGTNGYALSMVIKHIEEDGTVSQETEKMTETTGEEPRYFKSLSSVAKVLKEHGIFKFNVVQTADTIEVADRKAKEEVAPLPEEKKEEVKQQQNHNHKK